MKRFALVVSLVVCVFVLAAERPAEWARRIEKRGLPNLHQVSPSLYRSAQPQEDCAESVNELGIKTVVCLRLSEKDTMMPKNVTVHYVRLTALSVSAQDIIRVLSILTAPENGPCLVHCQHGADRTGVVCAAYRVCVQGWTKEAAVDEMRNGGFGFHRILTNLPKVVMKLNVEAIRNAIATIQKQDVPLN